jgi:hypothetical protein
MLSALGAGMHVLPCWCVRGLSQAQNGVNHRACRPSLLQTSGASTSAYRFRQCNGNSQGTACCWFEKHAQACGATCWAQNWSARGRASTRDGRAAEQFTLPKSCRYQGT